MTLRQVFLHGESIEVVSVLVKPQDTPINAGT